MYIRKQMSFLVYLSFRDIFLTTHPAQLDIKWEFGDFLCTFFAS